MAKISNDNILSSQQVNSLYKQVAKAFSEETENSLKIDLLEFKKQVDLILKQVKLEEVFHSGNPQKHKGWKILNQTARKRALMARGYVLIFKFREYLLNEKINYRYYFEDKQGISHATTFTEDNIMKYIKFGNQSIQLDPSRAKLADVAGEYNDLINHFFNMYTNPDENRYMRVPEGAYGRIVRSSIMRQYEHSNPGLRTKNNRYQMFNKGHIYEAIDISISDMLEHNETEDVIESYVFGKYLSLDNVRASQGADNAITNTSIKSGGADLYDYSTIRNQLELIANILKGGLYTGEELASIIEQTFLHQSKFINEEDFHKAAENAVNKLLKDFEKQLDLSLKK